jgi:hypothetical protein
VQIVLTDFRSYFLPRNSDWPRHNSFDAVRRLRRRENLEDATPQAANILLNLRQIG